MTIGTRTFSDVVQLIVPVPWQPGVTYPIPSGRTKVVAWSGVDGPKSPRLSSPHGSTSPAKKKLVRFVRPNAYTKTVTYNELGALIFRRSNGGSVQAGTLTVPGFTDSHCSFDVSQEYKVINKLRSKVYGSGFHPGIFAAEMPEALRMIRTSAERVRYGLLSAAIGDWRGVFRNFGQPRDYRRIKRAYLSYRTGRLTFSQFWLELQYGWLPLLGDIEQGAKYLAEALNGGATGISGRVSATRSWENTERCPKPTGGYAYWGAKTTRFRLRYVITDLRTSQAASVPSLPSVIGVAWEKLPYSFVCDWVVPISDYLAALRTASDIQGTVVRSMSMDTVFKEWTPKLDGSTGMVAYYNFSAYTERLERYDFVRTVSTEINPPAPVGDLSPSAIFSSWRRTANAVALLQNLRFRPGDITGIHKLLEGSKLHGLLK